MMGWALHYGLVNISISLCVADRGWSLAKIFTQRSVTCGRDINWSCIETPCSNLLITWAISRSWYPVLFLLCCFWSQYGFVSTCTTHSKYPGIGISDIGQKYKIDLRCFAIRVPTVVEKPIQPCPDRETRALKRRSKVQLCLSTN